METIHRPVVTYLISHCHRLHTDHTHQFPDHVRDGVNLHADVAVIPAVPHVAPREERGERAAHDDAHSIGRRLYTGDGERPGEDVTDYHDDKEYGRGACRREDVLAIVVFEQTLAQFFDLVAEPVEVGLAEGDAAHLSRRREQTQCVRLAAFVLAPEQVRPDVRLVPADDL